MAERITSRNNPMIRDAARLASSADYRREQGLFLAEGARLCEDAAKSGVAVRTLFCTARACEKYAGYLAEIRPVAQHVFEVEDHVAALLSGTKNTQGVFCVCESTARARRTADMAPRCHYLALENIQDPANLGAVLRTAEALGLGGVLLAGDCCDAYSPKALRAGMGAVFRLPLFFAESMAAAAAQLNRSGFLTLAAVPDPGAENITAVSFARPAVIAVGNEGNGLTREAVAACAKTVTIPMRGRAESLNASASAAILMWEMMRGGDCGEG